MKWIELEEEEEEEEEEKEKESEDTYLSISFASIARQSTNCATRAMPAKYGLIAVVVVAVCWLFLTFSFSLRTFLISLSSASVSSPGYIRVLVEQSARLKTDFDINLELFIHK